MVRKLSSLIICFTVLGCASRPDTAPIENATNIPTYLQTDKPAPATAPVAPVAANNEEPTSMGSLNDNSNSVKPVATATGHRNASRVAKKSAPATTSASKVTPVAGDSDWMIPTAGKTDGYQAGSKGVDIYGTEGQAIYATNSGKVVYSGNGLKGYGNLIIIKHNETYLTAYAHNKTNLVKEGAVIKRGQHIADMGTDDNGKAVLHFELRKNGKPIDPFILIKN